jgi:hypothetical protein
VTSMTGILEVAVAVVAIVTAACAVGEASCPAFTDSFPKKAFFLNPGWSNAVQGYAIRAYLRIFSIFGKLKLSLGSEAGEQGHIDIAKRGKTLSTAQVHIVFGVARIHRAQLFFTSRLKIRSD